MGAKGLLFTGYQLCLPECTDHAVEMRDGEEPTLIATYLARVAQRVLSRPQTLTLSRSWILRHARALPLAVSTYRLSTA